MLIGALTLPFLGLIKANIEKMQKNHDVKGLVRAAIRDWNEVGLYRGPAVAALIKIGGDDTVDALIVSLRDHNYIARVVSAYVLGELGNIRALDALSYSAIHDDNKDVRKFAVEALGKFGDPKGIETLLEASSDRSPTVRETATKALSSMRSDEVKTECLKALRNYNLHDSSRLAAAQHLVSMDAGTSTELPIILLAERDTQIRALGIERLKIMGEKGDDKAVEILRTVNDGHQVICASAIDALRHIQLVRIQQLKPSDTTAIEKLIDNLCDRYTQEIRLASAEAISKSSSEHALTSLIGIMQDADPNMRLLSIEAAKKSGSDQAILQLSQLLKRDDYLHLRLAAIEALGHIHTETSAKALVEAFLSYNKPKLIVIESKVRPFLLNTALPRYGSYFGDLQIQCNRNKESERFDHQPAYDELIRVKIENALFNIMSRCPKPDIENLKLRRNPYELISAFYYCKNDSLASETAVRAIGQINETSNVPLLHSIVYYSKDKTIRAYGIEGLSLMHGIESDRAIASLNWGWDFLALISLKQWVCYDDQQRLFQIIGDAMERVATHDKSEIPKLIKKLQQIQAFTCKYKTDWLGEEKVNPHAD